MAHKTLIGGTAYDITGGRTLIGGTGYDITKGRTLIGGTGYNINFATNPLQDFVALMADATLQTQAGRNSSSTGEVSLTSAQASDRYIFAFCDGAWSVSRDGTNIYHSDAQKAWSYYLNGRPFLSNNGGTGSASVYGGSLFSFTFPNYTTAQADAIIANLTTLDSAGRNSSTTGSISLSVAQTATVIAVNNTYMGLSSPIGTVIFGNYSTNPSLIYYSGGTASISTNGTSALSVRGGSVISLG